MGSLARSDTATDLAQDSGRSAVTELPAEAVVKGRAGHRSVTSMHSGLPIRWDRPAAELASARLWQLKVKRTIDVFGSLLGLVLLAPLMIIVAIAIKMTSPGPVFFRQRREGLNGSVFEALKFRSMSAELGDASGVSQTLSNDPRVTPVGRFIRKTSIDELPQLFNVLAGEMSLVGPRPHVPGMMAGGRLYKDLVPYYDRRLEMLPGITGWAQVNGLRGSTRDTRQARERIDHDLAYIQNFSVWLDLKIIVLTIVREFVTGSGD